MIEINILDMLKYALTSLKMRKIQTILTTLGVVIGIGAVVAMLSLSAGYQDKITNQFSNGLSLNVLTVSSGGRFGGFGGFGGYGGGETSTGSSLQYSDIDNISTIHDVVNVTGIIEQNVNVTFGTHSYVTNLIGVNFTAISHIYTTFTAANGSLPTTLTNNTIILGASLDNDTYNSIYYNLTDPVSIYNATDESQPVILQTQVGGILNTLGTSGFGMGLSDRAAYISVTEMEALFNTTTCNDIYVLINDTSAISTVESQIQNFFASQNVNVNVIASDSFLSTIESSLSTTTSFLSSIAGIALIVAGIGIMNIMTVSLVERTREIGLLKALGTEDMSILSIFIIEAIILGVLGSGIGIVVGWIIAVIYGQTQGNSIFGQTGGFYRGGMSATVQSITPIMTPETILLGFVFGILVSVIFGFLPAWKASRLKPVDALRSE